MKLKYFGTDGIRGKAYSFISLDLAKRVGHSLKHALGKKDVLIGIDTRKSSVDIKDALSEGIRSSGLNVYYAGVVSTPMVALYSKEKDMIGIMITASHNPYEDNGIKFFNGGNKLSKEEEILIEKHLEDKYILNKSLTNEEMINIEDLYLKYINDLLIKRDLNVVYDSANGANYKISHKVFSKYFKNSYQLANKPDGKNINFKSGATDLSLIKDYINKNKVDIGFAFDGDGDRLIVLDEFGNTYDGDYIIYIIAKHLKNNNKLTSNKVILTIMSNPGIIKALENLKIDYERVNVGDKYVYRKMLETNSIIGGEASGHIILRDYLDTGDGLLVALYLLKVLDETNMSLSELTKDIKLYPFKLKNIENVNKEIINDLEFINFKNEIDKQFNKEEVFHIRPSGTEPLLRVTMSMKDEQKLKSLMNKVVKFIKERDELLK